MNSASHHNTTAQLIQVLLPLSLLTGVALLTDTVSPLPQSLPTAPSTTQANTTPGATGMNLANTGFAGHCQHIGVRASSSTFQPLHQRGAFAGENSLECLAYQFKTFQQVAIQSQDRLEEAGRTD